MSHIKLRSYHQGKTLPLKSMLINWELEGGLLLSVRCSTWQALFCQIFLPSPRGEGDTPQKRI